MPVRKPNSIKMKKRESSMEKGTMLKNQKLKPIVMVTSKVVYFFELGITAFVEEL
jgi:hypothetical protein